jgi:DNA-binding response OmpR family regulator
MKQQIVKEKVLIVEDDADIVEILRYNLSKEGYEPIVAYNGLRGLEEAQVHRPALVLLDIMLPGMSGVEVCRELRAQQSSQQIPIIMLTAKSEETDIVQGLNAGADDYVTKPFRAKELLARVRAHLRRVAVAHGAAHGDVIQAGPITIDRVRHEVSVHNRVVSFTLAEFRLLASLASAPGRVFTRDHLLDKITGGEAVIIDRNVDVHVRAIRKKLREIGQCIEAVRGVGYKFRDR